jgi:hypothetical protein
MKSLYIYLIIILFLVWYLGRSIKDNFKNNSDKTIILLGDSVLNNSDYVEKDVLYNLKIKIGDSLPLVKVESKQDLDKKIINKAKDNGKIKDVYKQVEMVDKVLGIHESNIIDSLIIFLSVGGNDILESIFSMDAKYINKLFEDYKKLIIYLKKKYKSDIYVLNLYYPLNNRYKKYYDSIKIWNKLLETNKILLDYKILRIDEIMVSPNDFINDIEPSEIGSKKIAEEIANVL